MWCHSLKGIRGYFSAVLVCALIVVAVSSFASAQIVRPLESYGVGEYPIPVVEVPANAKEVAVSVKRDNWADTGQDIIAVRIEFSDDGGKTWAFLFGFKTCGGVLKNKSGAVADSTWMTFPLIGGSHTQRRIKGSLEVYSPLATEVSIGFEP